MPSTSLDADGVGRRRVLAGFGAAVAAAFAGCTGRLPGTEPEALASP